MHMHIVGEKGQYLFLTPVMGDGVCVALNI